jgi:hypothetical protein
MVAQAPPPSRIYALLTVTSHFARLIPVTMTTAPRSTAPQTVGSHERRASLEERPATAITPSDRRLRWLARALVVAGLGMVPWLVLLATQLPASTVAAHWSTAWVGLDAMETIGLLATGTLLLRRDHRSCLTATVTAALVFADAWFDVTTSAPGVAQLTAIAMATFIEMPVSVLSAVLALHLLRRHTVHGHSHQTVDERSVPPQVAQSNPRGARSRILPAGPASPAPTPDGA